MNSISSQFLHSARCQSGQSCSYRQTGWKLKLRSPISKFTSLQKIGKSRKNRFCSMLTSALLQFDSVLTIPTRSSPHAAPSCCLYSRFLKWLLLDQRIPPATQKEEKRTTNSHRKWRWNDFIFHLARYGNQQREWPDFIFGCLNLHLLNYVWYIINFQSEVHISKLENINFKRKVLQMKKVNR